VVGAGITWGAAFGAGLLSFASPCVLPLVPAYLCFLGGVSLDRLEAEDAPKGRVIAAAAAFVLGFATVFVALGASASAVGEVLAANLRWLSVVAGSAIVLLGLHYSGLLRLGWLLADRRLQVARKPPGLGGAYVIGLAFAFGWTPCVGPILAAILMLAAGRSSLGQGIGMLAAYAAGLGLPFLAAGWAMGPFLAWSRRFRRHVRLVEVAVGGLLAVTGVLILSGGMADIGNWLLEAFPLLGDAG
jgi:cytochrome c-type biogenesis protein